MKKDNILLALVNKVLFYGMLTVGLVTFIINVNDVFVYITAFGSFFASWALIYFFKRHNIQGNGAFWFWVNIFLWLNVAGELGLYYFSALPYYDKVIHFSTGILITAIVYAYAHYSRKQKISKAMVFFIALGAFAIWEIYEYLLYITFGVPVVGVIENGKAVLSFYDDTMLDMISGALGALIYLLIRKEKNNKIEI